VPTVDGDPELFHVVSGVSGSNNISHLGTKRPGEFLQSWLYSW